MEFSILRERSNKSGSTLLDPLKSTDSPSILKNSFNKMDNIFPNCCKLAFRFHNNDNKSLDEVSQILKEFPYHSGHIVAYEEDAERPHFQGYMLVSETTPSNDKFRRYIKKKFNLEGNKDYSISTVKDVKGYKKYIIKEGKWVAVGMDTSELLKYQHISYPKKKKFQEELDEIEISYLEDTMDDLQYISKFMLLKAKYKQPINTNYIKQRLLMLIVRKDEDRLQRIAHRIVDEIQLLERQGW